MTTPSSKEKVWSRWPNACVIESDIGGWFISLGLGDGRELAYRRDDDIEQLWNDAAANVNKFDAPASKLPALPTEGPLITSVKIVDPTMYVDPDNPDHLSFTPFRRPSPAVSSATEAAASPIADTATRDAGEWIAKASELLQSAAESFEDSPPTESWFRDYFTLTREHVVLTEEGWQPGNNKVGLIEEYGDEHILDELNAPSADISDSRKGEQ